MGKARSEILNHWCNFGSPQVVTQMWSHIPFKPSQESFQRVVSLEPLTNLSKGVIALNQGVYNSPAG